MKRLIGLVALLVYLGASGTAFASPPISASGIPPRQPAETPPQSPPAQVVPTETPKPETQKKESVPQKALPKLEPDALMPTINSNEVFKAMGLQPVSLENFVSRLIRTVGRLVYTFRTVALLITVCGFLIGIILFAVTSFHPIWRTVGLWIMVGSLFAIVLAYYSPVILGLVVSLIQGI